MKGSFYYTICTYPYRNYILLLCLVEREINLCLVTRVVAIGSRTEMAHPEYPNLVPDAMSYSSGRTVAVLPFVPSIQ